ncbi:protein FAM107B isoform X2 [Takifugu rubripes]|uniref:protein FAM107B isoform X2 n=1 Tax=Takifugu rubripes TaxID=31033 RepID=UPI0011458175|nr:protein FAM107B-like isoform X2 [Takifugu rubripes]
MEGSTRKKLGFGTLKKEPSVGHLSRHATVDYSNESALPRRLNGTSVDAPSYQNLHRELLLSHKRGLLLEEKPELKRVLEQRRLELHREEEMAQRRPSDLETELRKRQQKLEEVRVKKLLLTRIFLLNSL